MDYPRFTTADVADVAGVPVETLRSWVKRGDIMLVPSEPDRFTPGTGRNRLFTFKRALHIALTANLVRVGLSVKVASTLAIHFTDIGGAVGGYGDYQESMRPPGELFEGGGTVFTVHFPSGCGDPVGSVQRLTDVTNSPFFVDNHEYQTVLMVDLDNLVWQVRRKLVG